MIVEAQVTINGSRATIWAAITNIENASETISGIENIEVLEKPASRLVGLKWREPRTLFGKTATVEKRITECNGWRSAPPLLPSVMREENNLLK
jgi:hypothetical protein